MERTEYLVIGMGDAAMVTNLLNDMDLPEGSMQVYDGINLPFVKAREGGVVANKAIAEAWLENNPLRTLLESFEAVAMSVDMDFAPVQTFDFDGDAQVGGWAARSP